MKNYSIKFLLRFDNRKMFLHIFRYICLYESID